MKACKECRYIVESEKVCPKCGKDLTEKFSGMIIVIDPEHSKIAELVGLNAVGRYAVRVK